MSKQSIDVYTFLWEIVINFQNDSFESKMGAESFHSDDFIDIIEEEMNNYTTCSVCFAGTIRKSKTIEKRHHQIELIELQVEGNYDDK